MHKSVPGRAKRVLVVGTYQSVRPLLEKLLATDGVLITNGDT